eukprot:11458-Heterococcus_DN1.PRE.3
MSSSFQRQSIHRCLTSRACYFRCCVALHVLDVYLSTVDTLITVDTLLEQNAHNEQQTTPHNTTM